MHSPSLNGYLNAVPENLMALRGVVKILLEKLYFLIYIELYFC